MFSSCPFCLLYIYGKSSGGILHTNPQSFLCGVNIVLLLPVQVGGMPAQLVYSSLTWPDLGLMWFFSHIYSSLQGICVCVCVCVYTCMLTLLSSLFTFYWTFRMVYKAFFSFFCLFRAAPAAYGGSQSRGLIGAVSAGLYHSHSNAGSERRLQLKPRLTATPDP